MKGDALAAVFERYEREVFFYALSLCGDTHMAQGLVSDTFWKALLSLNGEKRSVRAWLFAVCRNTYIDSLRRRARHPREPLTDAMPAACGDPLEAYVEDEERRRVCRAVAGLPQPYRTCILLCYYSGVPTDEIARQLGTTPGNVRTILCRARQKLGKELRKDELPGEL